MARTIPFVDLRKGGFKFFTSPGSSHIKVVSVLSDPRNVLLDGFPKTTNANELADAAWLGVQRTFTTANNGRWVRNTKKTLRKKRTAKILIEMGALLASIKKYPGVDGWAEVGISESATHPSGLSAADLAHAHEVGSYNEATGKKNPKREIFGPTVDRDINEYADIIASNTAKVFSKAFRGI